MGFGGTGDRALGVVAVRACPGSQGGAARRAPSGPAAVPGPRERETPRRSAPAGLAGQARRRRLIAVLALAPLLLAGCQTSTGDLIGAGAGTAAAAGSGNPAVGVAVGVAARAAADWSLRYVSRRWHTTEQDALAAAVGGMEVGEARPWAVRHDLPIGNKRGEVRVLRAVKTPLAACKEALFSIDPDRRGEPEAPRRWFLLSACRQDAGWKWAVAEPATERWGSLQ